MSEMKPTPGPWVVLRSAGDQWYFRDGEMTIARAGDELDAIAVMDASAKTEEYFGIFAEALNMRDETGLTPRQLVERVKELEEALQQMLPELRGLAFVSDTASEMLRIADAALSKSLPNTVAETPSVQAPAAQGDAEDAARYRWLRVQDNEDFEFAVVKNPHFDVFESPEALDAAIDAERAALAQKEQSP